MNAKFHLLPVAGAVTLATALAGCAAGPDLYGQEGGYPVNAATTASYPATVASPPATVATAQVPVVEYGRVTNVSLVSGTPVAPTPGRSVAGTAIGAVVGGLLGNQIGRGVGRAAATVLGAGVGAAAGSNIARNTAPNAYASANPVYRVEVQTDQGVMRTYDVSATGDLHVGDRVRIENGVIYLA